MDNEVGAASAGVVSEAPPTSRPLIVVGIDPGITGALALLYEGRLLATADMPVMVRGKGKSKVQHEINAAGLVTVLRGWLHEELLVRARIVVEAVNSRPTSGPPMLCPACQRDRKALGSSTVFSMGDSSGVIRGVLAALGCSVEWVTPQSWKAFYRLAGGHDGKEAARAHAIRLYPAADLTRKKDHNRAEAILIARWAVERSMPTEREPF